MAMPAVCKRVVWIQWKRSLKEICEKVNVVKITGLFQFNVVSRE